jgi:hypothetical protein
LTSCKPVSLLRRSKSVFSKICVLVVIMGRTQQETARGQLLKTANVQFKNSKRTNRWTCKNIANAPFRYTAHPLNSVFIALVVSMLASGTQDCGFKPSQSRLSHVATLWHVKEPYNDVEIAFVRLNLIGYFSPIVYSFADRGLSRRLT